MDFYTIDSRVVLDKEKIIIKKLKYDPTKRYWFDSFFLFAILIAFQASAAVDGKPYKWILVIAALTWIYPHLERIYSYLFIKYWGNSIQLNKIVDITEPKFMNELESKVVIKIKSGRRKELIFREAEYQADGFRNAVSEAISNLSVIPNI